MLKSACSISPKIVQVLKTANVCQQSIKISDLSDGICQSYIGLVNKVNFKILKNKLFCDSFKNFLEKN